MKSELLRPDHYNALLRLLDRRRPGVKNHILSVSAAGVLAGLLPQPELNQLRLMGRSGLFTMLADGCSWSG